MQHTDVLKDFCYYIFFSINVLDQEQTIYLSISWGVLMLVICLRCTEPGIKGIFGLGLNYYFFIGCIGPDVTLEGPSHGTYELTYPREYISLPWTWRRRAAMNINMRFRVVSVTSVPTKDGYVNFADQLEVLVLQFFFKSNEADKQCIKRISVHSLDHLFIMNIWEY